MCFAGFISLLCIYAKAWLQVSLVYFTGLGHLSSLIKKGKHSMD